MPLLNRTIAGFFNGVSQQAPTNRRDTQAEMQVNAIGTLVDGLMKRPPAEHKAVLTSNAASGAFTHKINRDVSERYLVIITNNATAPIEVYTPDGTKCTVRYGTLDADLNYTAEVGTAQRDYLTYTTESPATSPAKRFKALTVVDRTIIANRERTTNIQTTTVPGSITGHVQTFSDLPASPTDGDIYEIVGDEVSNFDNYYVKYNGTDGVWDETVKPGVRYIIRADRMPHQLVRTDVNEFTFAPIIWADREIGDDTSNPGPSFAAGKEPITNVFFYKNRLGFLAGQNIVLSRAGDYFNFWRETAIDLLDSDPIDTAAAGASVEILRSAAVFDKGLLVLGDQQQYNFGSGDSALSPTTVAATPTTSYQIDPDAEPVTAGANVYFVCPADPLHPSDGYAAVREYFIQPDSMLTDAADVTAHVPRYIPQGYIQLQAINTLDVLFAHSDATPSKLYVYKYYWTGSEKPQSAWSEWEFDGDILSIATIQNRLYIVIQRGSQLCLESIRIDRADTGSLGFTVNLDRLHLQEAGDGTYDSGDDTTTWTLPYSEDADLVIVDGATGLQLGGVVNNQDGTVTADGDYSATDVWIGIDYEMRYRLSEWYMRDAQGAPITSGRLQVRSLTLSFRDTGYFRVEVTPFMRDTLVQTLSQEMTGVLVGVSTIGEVSILSGENRFLVMAKSKQTKVDIVNDTYLPCYLQTGNWEGYYHARAINA